MKRTRAFDKIAAGLNDAIAIARGETKPARLHVPSELDAEVTLVNEDATLKARPATA